MKNLTIRMKVTLWYAFFMFALITIFLMLISDLSSKAMLNNQKKNLIDVVMDGIDDISSYDNFEFFENGVYLMIYDENETYKNGIIPEGFSTSMPLLNDYVQTIESNALTFYVYDIKISDETDTQYWMRGVVPQSEFDPIGVLTVVFASGFLPILALLTCVIGYFITKRAFAPVKKIQETAQNIADNDELSLRIGLPEGKDEIAKLAQTVDYMLDKLERSFEKEKQFTSDVSHEIRTPIAVILTESEYALQHAQSLEEAKESMEVVNRQANKMSALVNQLLFFSRSDNGSLVLNNETFDAIQVITELVQDYQILTETTGITISLTENLETHLNITADKMLFTRCLSNIIENAIHYSNPKGHIDITALQENNYLTIAITDDGIGISPEQQEKIWDRFYQVDESRSKIKGNGMGLGLSMVKTIIEKHGGYVTVHSVPDKGSTFTLYFQIR